MLFLNTKMLHQKPSASFSSVKCSLIYILKLPEHLWSVLMYCPFFPKTSRSGPGWCLRLTRAVSNVKAAGPGREMYPPPLCNTVNFLFCSALRSFSFPILFCRHMNANWHCHYHRTRQKSGCIWEELFSQFHELVQFRSSINHWSLGLESVTSQAYN